MWRRGSSSIFTLVVVLTPWFGLTAAYAQDDVSAFLDRLGLKQILVAHLERQLETAEGDDRETIALRLAPLYADLLEAVTDDARRELLVQRSRELIQQVPEDAADELRLALLRSPFRAAERTAEQHRLRQAEDIAVTDAVAVFEEIIPQFDALRSQFDDASRGLERRRNRASGIEQAALNERLERLYAMKADATFLQAWSQYYLTLLTDREEHARRAQYLFAELLNLETPEPRGVSVDLRELEPVARSILGLALCKSRIASTSSAFEWLDLLEGGEVFQPVRAQVPAWRLVVLLEHDEYDEALQMLLEESEARREVPVYWLRLCIVNAIETRRPSRAATGLVQHAVTELAARSELQEVLELATRYGIESLGSSGFALLFVDGVLQYNEAREVHQSEHPATDRAVVGLFANAEQALHAAATADDAASYRQAVGSCLKLLGWSRYFQGKFIAAREAFELATAQLTGDDAAQSLWMAIVCLDKVVEAGASASMESQLAALIERFLEEFPASEYAPKLVLKRAETAPIASRDMIDELLAVPSNSDIYAPARSRAATMLYQLYREADEDEAIDLGNEYLGVAVPLINVDDPILASPNDTLWAPRVTVRCRRVLEVALQPDIARLEAARRALETIERLQMEFGIDLTENADELDYRRLELHLLDDLVTDAADLADLIHDRASDSIWTRLSSRALFRYGYERWRGGTANGDNRQFVDMVVRYGLRVIREYENNPAALRRTNVASYYIAVGDASMLVWRRSQNRTDAETALRLYDALLAVRRNNAHLLRSTAELYEALGQPDQALDHWRRLASGLSEADEAWYEARWHQIDLLRQLDPVKAREVMNQHKQLHPELGPPPWDSRMRDLDTQIPDSASPDQDGSGGGGP